jgi:hypothetical protein
MLRVVAVTLLAFGTAAFTYLGLERVGRRGWLALVCRGIAWTALGLLLINLSCPVPGRSLRPLVLLDASLSMGGPGGRWTEALDSATAWGEVRRFGDEHVSADSSASRGRSLLAPSLLAASASDHPVIVVSDGELEDVAEIPPDILARSTIRLFPRKPEPDLAITHVTGPARVTAGDSIPLEIEVQTVGEGDADTVAVQVLSGTNRLATRTVRLRGPSAGRLRLKVPSGRLAPGDHLLRVTLPRAADAEARTDTRLHLITVTATPGVVLLASSADWDSRFLYRTLREVGQLPVRGYVRLERERWRSMNDLRPVSPDLVRRAARRADLLILKGAVPGVVEGASARGIWSWPSGEAGPAPLPGDWYLSPSESSPVAGAFQGQPVDSFPPAIQLSPVEGGPRDWVALYAQLGRRGPQRVAVFGRQDGRIRRVVVAVEGLWRWAFRGGPSEQSYRSWVAATTSWLLGEADSAMGSARPVQAVVANGRPLIFEWVAAGPPSLQTIVWSGPAGEKVDTLRFDGSGRATVWLPPGEYRYRLGAAGGTAAVEQYSDELLPHPLTVTPHAGRSAHTSGRTSARDWLWLFALCVLGLSGEWIFRRRLGLR